MSRSHWNSPNSFTASLYYWRNDYIVIESIYMNLEVIYLLFHSFENVLSRILLYIVKIVLKVEKKRVLFVKEGDTLTTKTSEEKHTD